MVQITLTNINPASVPADGWIVGYRIKGSGGAYTVLPPFNAAPIVFQTTDPAGTLYEGYIKRDCGTLESTDYFWTTPCQCSSGFTIAPSGEECQQISVIPATVSNAGYCLAPSVNGAYSGWESRIYTLGFNNGSLKLPPGTIGSTIAYRMLASPQWANLAANLTDGPMNREGVWIDSDCNGVKDALGVGVSTTIAFQFVNSGIARTIYVGVGADNTFKLNVNGILVAENDGIGNPQSPFKFWHIIPIQIVQGINYINLIATGDGSVNDAMAMVVYDNTALQIATAVNDSSLNILFKSSQLRGSSYDVATCPSDYSLDTSSGQGNYQCVKTTYKICNSFDT